MGGPLMFMSRFDTDEGVAKAFRPTQESDQGPPIQGSGGYPLGYRFQVTYVNNKLGV